MVDQSLVDMLVCPETKQSLSVADTELLDRLNAAIREGSVKNVGGEAVTAPVDEGLVREDRAVLYPVREDIPIMIIDESIPLSS